MLDMPLDELKTEEQREGAAFDLAQRIVKRGITDDRRVIERAIQTIQRLTSDRQSKTLPDVSGQLEAVGEAEGYGTTETS